MQRVATDEEREAQLQAWDASLVQRQRTLEDLVTRFQHQMKREVEEATSMRKQIQDDLALLEQRERDVTARELRVGLAEDALLQASRALQERQAEFVSNIAKSVQELASQESVEDATATSSPSTRSPASTQAITPPSSSSKKRSVETTAGSPQSAGRPHIPLISMSQLAAAAGSGTGTNHTPARSSQRNGRGESPQMYEGPVDNNLPSMVEEIDDEEATPHKPRGLRSSPQFHPMDPNDSGLGFLRTSSERFQQQHAYDEDDDDDNGEHDGAHDDDEVGEESHDGGGVIDGDQLQALFDEAVEFLITHNIARPEVIEEWLQEGASAQQIIELYQRESAARTFDDDDGDFEQHGMYEEEEYFDDEDDDDEDGGARRSSESSGAARPITVDPNSSILEDGEHSTKGEPPGAGHDDSLTSNRVRGGSQTTPPASLTHHGFDSFDDSDDDDDVDHLLP